MGIRRALATSTAERYVAMFGNFATLAVVSRWLTPTEIGSAVLASTIAVFVMCLREFVSVDFIVQRRELSAREARTVLTLVYIASAVLAAIIFLSADWLGARYGNDGLPLLLRLSAACLLIEGLSSPTIAVLRRHMAFEKIAVINSIGMAVFASSAIALALSGYGALSLVLNWLASSSVVAFLYFVTATDRGIYRPSLSATREVFRFGVYSGINTLLYRIYDSLPYLFLGRVLPVSALALYNRSVNLVQLPDKMFLGGVSGVMLSAMSAEVRNGRSLARHYLHGLELITALQTPALLVMAVLAHPIVLFVLGPQWTEAVPLVRIMAVAMLVSFSTELNNPVLLALGQMRWFMIRSLLTWPVGAMMLGAASLFGLKAAAIAWLFIMPWLALVSIAIVKHHISVSWRDIFAVLRSAAVIGALTVLGPLVIIAAHPTGFALPVSIGLLAGVAAACGWFLGLWATDHTLLREIKGAAAHVLQGVLIRVRTQRPVSESAPES